MAIQAWTGMACDPAHCLTTQVTTIPDNLTMVALMLQQFKYFFFNAWEILY